MSSADSANYRGLWSAVMLQAFADLKPRKFLTPTPLIVATGNKAADDKRMKCLLQNRRHTQREWDHTRATAHAWVFSDNSKPCSFIWICEHLDLDHEWLRKMAASNDGIDSVLLGNRRLKR